LPDLTDRNQLDNAELGTGKLETKTPDKSKLDADKSKLDADNLRQIFPELPEDIDIRAFDQEHIPVHLAVIMDGNGRWATARGMTRVQGHAAGIKAVRELIRTSNDVGIRYLTIFSFSSENWSRPRAEVTALMSLLAKTMAAELKPMSDEGVRIQVIGDMSPLPESTRRVFLQAIQTTRDNQGMTLVVALNYGGRQDILRAAQELAHQAAAGAIDTTEIDQLTVEDFAARLDTAAIPDPDLLIRTSGEYRLSNFMLYQSAYAEMYFCPGYWPDFDRYELLRALLAYQKRNRRFGTLDGGEALGVASDEGECASASEGTGDHDTDHDTDRGTDRAAAAAESDRSVGS
jgi:undecaprenyl diphosphate synthase